MAACREPPGGCPAPNDSCTVRNRCERLDNEHRKLERRRHPPRATARCHHLQAELTFDGVHHSVSVRSVGGDLLEIAVERTEDASTWSAAFAAKCAPRSPVVLGSGHTAFEGLCLLATCLRGP